LEVINEFISRTLEEKHGFTQQSAFDQEFYKGLSKPIFNEIEIVIKDLEVYQTQLSSMFTQWKENKNLRDLEKNIRIKKVQKLCR